MSILSMFRYVNRLDSFVNWPVTHKRPQDLAKDGFFYTGRTDVVQCAFCFGTLSNWLYNDNITEQHRRRFPQCPTLQSNKSEGKEKGFIGRAIMAGYSFQRVSEVLQRRQDTERGAYESYQDLLADLNGEPKRRKNR